MDRIATTDPVLTVLRALGDEIRLGILRAVFVRPRNVGQLVRILDVSQPDVSHHLRRLREAELLIPRRRGRHVWYEVNESPPREVAVFLNGLREAWRVPMNEDEGGLHRDKPLQPTTAAAEAVVRDERQGRHTADMEDYLL